MPFTAQDLRYRIGQSYPLLYAYLHRHAQRYLGQLQFDAFEVDTVVGHVVEQLVRLGLLGRKDTTAPTALEHLSNAQFYAFLNRSIKNKAIDRLRKHRLLVSTTTELDKWGSGESDEAFLDEAVESIWGAIPFPTPEQMSLLLVSQKELRSLLVHCIMVLKSAPHQFQAVMQEMQELGVDELFDALKEELDNTRYPLPEESLHISQHRDHAHRKLRHCLQKQSTNLIVRVAFRLTEYGVHSGSKGDYEVEVQTLVEDTLPRDDVQAGLKRLVAEGLATWNGGEVVHITPEQMKRLKRFYQQE